MKERVFKKILLTFILITLILGATYVGVGYLKTQGLIKITQGTEGPYTVEQVETMMRYHGAQIAKFQDGRWFFLKDGQWIAIENGNALEFALSSTPETPTLN